MAPDHMQINARPTSIGSGSDWHSRAIAQATGSGFRIQAKALSGNRTRRHYHHHHHQ